MTTSSIHRFLVAPAFPTEKENRSANWLNAYLLGAILFGAIMSLLSILSPSDADSLGSGNILLIGTIWHIFSWLALRQRKLQLAIFLVFLILFGMVTYSMLVFDGIRATSVIGYFLLMAIVSLLATPRMTIVATLVCLVAILIIYYLEQIDLINASFSPKAVPFNLVLLAVTLILNSLMLWLNVRQMSHSIVEAKQAAQKLVAEVNKTQAILSGIGEGVLVFDNDGKILLLNPAGQALLGQSEKELEGLGIEEYIRTGLIEIEVSSLIQRFQHFEHNLAEWKVVWKERVLSLRSSPVKGDRGQKIGTVVVFRDVTAEEEISQMKSDFISIASHELRTPLTSVKGFINILLDEVAGTMSVEQRRLLQIAKDNADRLHDLVDDLLDLSRIESGRMELERSQLSILPVIEDLVGQLSGMASKKGLTLKVEMPAFVPLVWADERHVNQILTNLLSNAIKYTRQGGATIYSDISNGFLRIHVRDTGFGISQSDQAKLFGRFFRSEDDGVRMEPGTGLGLHIVQALVMLQGGDLSVKSELGQGSTFTFTLPLVASEDEIRLDEPIRLAV
jgi:two-component system phosphate regulon sensor histidine kinase PhoR